MLDNRPCSVGPYVPNAKPITVVMNKQGGSIIMVGNHAVSGVTSFACEGKGPELQWLDEYHPVPNPEPIRYTADITVNDVDFRLVHDLSDAYLTRWQKMLRYLRRVLRGNHS